MEKDVIEKNLADKVVFLMVGQITGGHERYRI